MYNQEFKIALGIEYEGTQYHGWQKQNNAITIQSLVEKAISKVANHKVEVVCAGRTDKGVHATLQVVHFISFSNRTKENWVLGINANLPLDIRVIWVKEVKHNFNARFSAVERRYKYYIYNSNIKSALIRNNVTFYHKMLDCDKMQNAANFWIGEHDFSSFRDSDCQSKTAIRVVKQLTVHGSKQLIIFDIIANSFLHHMVRNMVGTLIQIGSGKYDVTWAKDVLLAKDRTKAGVTALAQGLYLVDVVYPKEFDLPLANTSSPCSPWFFSE